MFKKNLKTKFTALVFFSFICISFTQNLYFPPINNQTWDTLSMNSLGWCTQELSGLYNYLDNNNTKAFMVLKDGKIVIEKYFGNFTSDSLWYWASAGKSLTAFTVGIAQEEGHLSLADSTSKYLGSGWTSCLPEDEAKITIRHQLCMTTGLDDGVLEPHCTNDTCLVFISEAGTRWAYHNAPYTLLDDVITSATGVGLNTYINQKIKVHTGITGTFIKLGYNNVFFSTARSMARFGLLMLNKGRWAQTSILADTNYFNAMVNSSQNLNLSYGYLWWLNGKNSFMLPYLQYVFNGSWAPNAPTDMYAALGKNGQILNIVPSQNLIVLRMGNAPDAGDVAFLLNDTIWQKLNAVMCNASVKEQSKLNNKKPSIFPNPTSDIINIEFDNQNFRMRIFDALGRNIFINDMAQNKEIIEISSYKKGLYFIQIIDCQDNTYFDRFVKW